MAQPPTVEPHVERPGPAEFRDPLVRREVQKAAVWFGMALAIAGVIVLAQPLLLIVGGMIFAVFLDGGTRMLGKVLPIPRHGADLPDEPPEQQAAEREADMLGDPVEAGAGADRQHPGDAPVVDPRLGGEEDADDDHRDDAGQGADRAADRAGQAADRAQ